MSFKNEWYFNAFSSSFNHFFIPDVQAICTPSDTLSTQPLLPDNILASGYVNFTVQACIDFSYQLMCSWKYNSIKEWFYAQFFPCRLTNSHNYSIKCEMLNEIINTNFTLLVPALTGNNIFALLCDNKYGVSLHMSIAVIVQGKLIISDNANTAMIFVMNR